MSLLFKEMLNHGGAQFPLFIVLKVCIIIRNKFIAIVILSIIAAILLPLTGCFTTDKYHNKKHIDTFEKNMDSVHKDIDRVLGVDVPSPLVEEK